MRAIGRVLQQKIKNARLLFERDSVIDVELLEEVLNQSVYGKYWLEMADAYLLLSEMNKATGQCENAIKNAKRANETYTSLNQSKGYFASVHILASCYVILENYDMAEQYYSTAITVCKKSDKEEDGRDSFFGCREIESVKFNCSSCCSKRFFEMVFISGKSGLCD